MPHICLCIAEGLRQKQQPACQHYNSEMPHQRQGCQNQSIEKRDPIHV